MGKIRDMRMDEESNRRKSRKEIEFSQVQKCMTYVRLLVNNTAVNENMFRMGLDESRECECGESIQSVSCHYGM